MRRSGLEVLLERLAGDDGRIRTVKAAPDGALWIVTSNTGRATWGGTGPGPATTASNYPHRTKPATA